MENAIYYTLSTIAQTLAGALAVLVAFVLFRLTDLDRKISHGKSSLRRYEGVYPQSWQILLEQKGMEALSQRLFGGQKPPLQLQDLEAAEEAYEALHTRPIIKRRLDATLWFSAADIALCFATLPFARLIACSLWATVILLAVAVILGMVCLGLYIWLIRAIVERPAD